jgi:hypothetical protein
MLAGRRVESQPGYGAVARLRIATTRLRIATTRLRIATHRARKLSPFTFFPRL